MIDKIDQLIAILQTMQGHLEARKTAAHWVDVQIEMQQYGHCFEKGYPIAQAIQKEVAAYKASMGLSVGQNPTPAIRERFGYRASDVLFFWNYCGLFVNRRSDPTDFITALEALKKYWLMHHEGQDT